MLYSDDKQLLKTVVLIEKENIGYGKQWWHWNNWVTQMHVTLKMMLMGWTFVKWSNVTFTVSIYLSYSAFRFKIYLVVNWRLTWIGNRRWAGLGVSKRTIWSKSLVETCPKIPFLILLGFCWTVRWNTWSSYKQWAILTGFLQRQEMTKYFYRPNKENLISLLLENLRLVMHSAPL